MSRLFLFSSLLCALACPSWADPVVIFEETPGDLGTDLSDVHNNPTPVGVLPLGESAVIGYVENADRSDADIFTFTVDNNQGLDAILLSVEGTRHFWAIGEGTQISTSTNPDTRLRARLVSDSDDGVNLLTDVPAMDEDYGGTGLTSPLGPGDYTIWIQETALENFAFTFTFQTSTVTSIPEPSSVLALGLAGVCVSMRRRRRG